MKRTPAVECSARGRPCGSFAPVAGFFRKSTNVTDYRLPMNVRDRLVVHSAMARLTRLVLPQSLSDVGENAVALRPQQLNGGFLLCQEQLLKSTWGSRSPGNSSRALGELSHENAYATRVIARWAVVSIRHRMFGNERSVRQRGLQSRWRPSAR